MSLKGQGHTTSRQIRCFRHARSASWPLPIPHAVGMPSVLPGSSPKVRTASAQPHTTWKNSHDSRPAWQWILGRAICSWILLFCQAPDRCSLIVVHPIQRVRCFDMHWIVHPQQQPSNPVCCSSDGTTRAEAENRGAGSTIACDCSHSGSRSRHAAPRCACLVGGRLVFSAGRVRRRVTPAGCLSARAAAM